MRKVYCIVPALVLGFFGTHAWAQGVVNEQQKLLAKRAAEADAYRKLAEAVYGLEINSRTSVHDFVTESDEIRGTVDTFVKGVRLGDPVFYEDGSCEVPAEVTVAKVIETLRTAYDRDYDGDSVKATDFESMSRRIEKRVIKAIGMGAPRVDLPPEVPEPALALIEPVPANLPGVPPPIPDIWRQVGPQARLMAIRAARMDAQRKLAERIKGLRLTARTQVRDFVAETDVIMTEMRSTLVGAEEVGTYLHHDELIAEVTMRVPTEQVITTIKKLHNRHYKGDDLEGADIEKRVKRVVKKDFSATGMGVPPARYVRGRSAAMQGMPHWAGDVLEAQGEGTDPHMDTAQGRLKAARAAELDAKRKLAERIAGLTIQSETKVRDFVSEYDHISSQVSAVLVDVVVKETEFTGDSAKVTVALPGVRVWDVVADEVHRQKRQN